MSLINWHSDVIFGSNTHQASRSLSNWRGNWLHAPRIVDFWFYFKFRRILTARYLWYLNTTVGVDRRVRDWFYKQISKVWKHHAPCLSCSALAEDNGLYRGIYAELSFMWCNVTLDQAVSNNTGHKTDANGLEVEQSFGCRKLLQQLDHSECPCVSTRIEAEIKWSRAILRQTHKKMYDCCPQAK